MAHLRTTTRLTLLGASVWFLAEASAFPQVNLASGPEGARIAAVSSALGKDFGAENVIDGDPRTTWATAKGRAKDAYVVIKLAARRATAIGAVALDNSVAEGHPAEASMRHFRLAVSTTGTAEEDFLQVKLGSCNLGAGRQVFTFSPERALYVKLTLGGNFGYPDWAELADVEVYAAGTAPAGRTGTPAVLLQTTEADPVSGAFGALARALSEVGAAVSAFPGDGPTRPLTGSALLGSRVVVVTGEPPLSGDDVRVLLRHTDNGAGLVCPLPDDPAAVRPLLDAAGATVSPGPAADSSLRLAPHWTTENLVAPAIPPPPWSIAIADGAPLAVRSDGHAVALAAPRGSGRVVLLARALMQGDGSRDAVELARRVVLWAAGMEDVPPVQPPAPVSLSGAAVFLPASGEATRLTFRDLRQALADHGLDARDAAHSMAGFGRPDLGDARLLIAFMPALESVAAIDLAHWIASGGRLLLLGDAGSDVPGLMAVNAFTQHLNIAMTLSPSRGLSVAVKPHPATAGIEALGRPGEPLGVWCLQGEPLAEMAATPVAQARSYGAGRIIALDAGFACDPMTESEDRKKPAETYGIELAQNREFLLRCVAWLLEQP